MLKAAVIGVGHLGNFHAQKYVLHADTDLLGIFDLDFTKAKTLAAKYNTRAYESMDELLDAVDLVSIATPATTHYDPSILAINKSVHVLVEKPFTHDYLEAQKIVKRSIEKDVYVQVGFLERFNSVLTKTRSLIDNPLFAECHRLSAFTGRSIDIDVIKDIMIHDIDLMLFLFKEKGFSEAKRVIQTTLRAHIK
jgi:predicted dehydrogenase